MHQPDVKDRFTQGLPKLTDNPLPIKPPFVFNGMSARVFPLRAHLGALQRVSDGYLNFVPPEAGYFRVPLPYVFMMILDYGQVAEAVARIGWFAQTEVFFMIPLEWYKLEAGRWAFHDWAVITPYVFVNDDFSVPLGRTVFGFPKVLARVMQTQSAWIRDPNAPVTLARVETSIFPQTYAGAEIQNRVLLEIERSTLSNLRVPFDAASAMMPWTIASSMAQAAGGFGRDALWLAQSMRLSPVNAGTDPGIVPEMLQRMMPWFALGGKGFVQNSINLKQFRRSDKPSQICYQALTNGRMETRAFNGAGLLGEYSFLLGDLSGGHTVRLYEYASLAIARTLGLEIEREWQGPDCTVAELKPVVPFWLDVDIQYDQGENLAWRTNESEWKDGAGQPFPSQSQSSKEPPAYNSTVTTVIDDIAGPFELSDTTVRVLPLLAYKAKVQHFLDGYINHALGYSEHPHPDFDPTLDRIRSLQGHEEHIRFKVWTRPDSATPGQDLAYVYMMVTSFGNITSTTDNVGDWTKYQLSFMIPVRFERMDDQGKWILQGVGLVPAFSFVDNCIAAIARLEVQGFQAVVANFYKPESVWLSDEIELSDQPHQTLLRVDTEVWPAIGQGQKAIIQPLIEVCQGDPDAGLGTAPDAPWRWCETLRAELGAKKRIKSKSRDDLKIARALALELLGNQMPFTAYSMKQFRDAGEPEKACYQSLVKVPRQIKELVAVQEIEDTLVVTIHNYPSLDIVGQLGLVAAQLPGGSSGVVSTAQAIRPFFVRGTFYEPLALRLAYRAGSRQWWLDPQIAFSTLLGDDGTRPPITADLLAETLQDQMDPSRIRAVMFQAAQRLTWTAERRNEKDAPAITLQQARDALAQVDPQTVIECILSREWGNADENARWRAGRQKIVNALNPVRSADDLFVQSTLCIMLNNNLADAPGAVASQLLIPNVKETLNKAFQNPNAPRSAPAQPPTTAAGRHWQTTIASITGAYGLSTMWRAQMDKAIGNLVSFTIAGMLGLAQLDPDNLKEQQDNATKLLRALKAICSLEIKGQPSSHNNLDTRVVDDRKRLKERMEALFPALMQGKSVTAKPSPEVIQWAIDHVDQLRSVVDLAHAICDTQYEAVLNKLSRAYQKPDFCVRRDSVGADCNQFLPLSLSWDPDWYYGPTLAKVKSAPKADTPEKMDSVAEGSDKGAKG